MKYMCFDLYKHFLTIPFLRAARSTSNEFPTAGVFARFLKGGYSLPHSEVVLSKSTATLILAAGIWMKALP